VYAAASFARPIDEKSSVTSRVSSPLSPQRPAAPSGGTSGSASRSPKIIVLLPAPDWPKVMIDALNPEKNQSSTDRPSVSKSTAPSVCHHAIARMHFYFGRPSKACRRRGGRGLTSAHAAAAAHAAACADVTNKGQALS